VSSVDTHALRTAINDHFVRSLAEKASNQHTSILFTGSIVDVAHVARVLHLADRGTLSDCGLLDVTAKVSCEGKEDQLATHSDALHLLLVESACQGVQDVKAYAATSSGESIPPDAANVSLETV
jgi:hypothetical protein